MADSVRCAECEQIVHGDGYVLTYPNGTEKDFCPDGACLKRKVAGIIPEAPGVAPQSPTRDEDVVPETSVQDPEKDIEEKLEEQQPPSVQEQMETLEEGERYRKGDPPKDIDKGVLENNDQDTA